MSLKKYFIGLDLFIIFIELMCMYGNKTFSIIDSIIIVIAFVDLLLEIKGVKK